MKKVISVFGAVTLTASMFFPCTIVQAADVDTSAEEILIDEDQAIELLEAEDISTYKDGVYTGVGAGKRGDITLSVTISEGRVSELSEVSQKETPSFWEKAKALLTDRGHHKTGPVHKTWKYALRR